MAEKFIFTIRFMDGESMKFQLTPESDAQWTRATRIEDLLQLQILTLEVDGKILALPICNIRSLEIASASGSAIPPATIPETAVRNLQLIE